MALAYKCRGCGIIRPTKWSFRCPGCGGFYDIRQTTADISDAEDGPAPEGEVVSLNSVTAMSVERISTGIDSIDRVLGIDKIAGIGGIAAKSGHVIQIFGSPGSGKSTLILQICRGITKQRHSVLYIAGEEPLEQIKERADRIGKFNAKMNILREHDLDAIVDKIDEISPDIVVVDSIQTVSVEEYVTGSMAAAIIAAREIVELCKSKGIGLVLVVQVNKSGDFSGPASLEHLVDTSLYLRGNKDRPRVLECNSKNRFASTPMSAYFMMTENGLVETDEMRIDDNDDEKKAPLITTAS